MCSIVSVGGSDCADAELYWVPRKVLSTELCSSVDS